MMRADVKPDAQPHAQFDEEEQGENYIKERVKSLGWVKKLSFLAILLLIAQIVLIIIHLTIHGLDLAWNLLFSSIFFLIGAILAIYWSNNATKAYKANTELFQPRVNDRLTKTIYIGALLSALIAVVLLVNLLVQREYSPDFVVAHSAVNATWTDNYGSRTPEGISTFLRVIFWIQFGFTIFYLIYFILVARTAFKCLKFSNQAMSYLVFLGNVLLLAFGLAVIYFADHALGYGDYPQVRAHFPFWNVRGLYFAGICVAAVALLGFLVDHRSWRVGFLVLSFLLLILIVLLGNFTGFAYRHVKQTYDYYKGIPDRDTCLDRMKIVHFQELEDYGCPQKYLPDGAPCDNPEVLPWEQLGTTITEQSKSDRDQRTAQTQPQSQTQTQDQTAPTQTEDQPAQTDNTQPQAATTTNDQDQTTTTSNTQTTASDDGSTTTTTTTTTTSSSSTTSPSTLTLYEVDLNPQRYEYGRVLADDDNYYCLNSRCCGLLGQLYTEDFLSLANSGLLAMLAAILISIACYYFWFVKWVDAARDKRKDYVWLVIMIVVILAFVFAFVAWNVPYIQERLDSAGRHLEISSWN